MQSQDVRKQSPSTKSDSQSFRSNPSTFRNQRSQNDKKRDEKYSERQHKDNHPNQRQNEIHLVQKSASTEPILDSMTSLPITDEAIAILVEMGFSQADATDALTFTNADIEAAAMWLTNSHRSIHSHQKHGKFSQAVKFRIASSVQLDASTHSSLSPPNEWFQQVKQQSNSKSVRAPKAISSAQLSRDSNVSNADKSFVESRKQQELKDNLLSMQRTKQYLLQQDSCASSSTRTPSSRSLQSASPDVMESDLDLFVRTKAQVFEQMFGHYSQTNNEVSTLPALPNEWLELVRTKPLEALASIERVQGDDFICIDSVLVAKWTAIDVQGNNAIHLCCQHNHVKLLRCLLQMRVSQSVSSLPSMEATANAASNPSTQSDSDSDSQSQANHRMSNQQRFVFDVNAINHHRISAVHICCRYNSLDCLRLLLERFALLDVKDARGFRPLHAAAAVGDVECMELLIENSGSQRIIQLMPRTKSHQTPLHLAAQFGHHRAVTYLHRLQKNAMYIKDKNQNTLLNYAVGWPHVMEYILQSDKSGGTSAPINSSSGNFSDPSQRLVNALNANFESALRHCLELPRSLCEVCMLLLLNFDASTDPFASRISAQAEVIFGPFDIGKVVNQHPRNRPNLLRKSLRQSIELESAPHHKKKQITTVLHEAARKGLLYAVQLLITVGKANVECVSHPQGNTPLHYACRNGHLPVVEFLLRVGSSPLRLNKLGFNSLMICAKYRQIQILQRIIQKVQQRESNQDDIHTMREYVSNNRDSCFSLALQYGSVPIVQLLIREGMYHFDKNEQQVSKMMQAKADGIVVQSRVGSCVRRILEMRSVLPISESIPPLADVKLVCADHQSHLFAHRCILAGRSEYFSSMIRQTSTLHSTLSTDMTELHLSHLSFETLRVVLNFLYTGTLDRFLTASALIDLLLCANELLLPTLLQCCLRIAGANGYLSAHGLSLNTTTIESARLFPSFQGLQSIIAPQFHAHLQSCTSNLLDSTNSIEDSSIEVPAALDLDEEWESKEEDSDLGTDAISTIRKPAAAVASAESISPSTAPKEVDLISEPLHELDGSFLQLLRRSSQQTFCADITLIPNDVTLSSPPVIDSIRGLEDDDDAEEKCECNSASGMNAHRVMLSLSSARLAALCEGAPTSPPSPRVFVDISSSNLQLLLNCIYGHSLCLVREIEAVRECDRALAAVPDAYPSSPYTVQDVIGWINTVHDWIDPTSMAFDCFQQQLVVLIDTYSAYYTQVPANLCELFFACEQLAGSFKLLFMKLCQMFVKHWHNLCDWNDQALLISGEDVDAVRRSELQVIAREVRWNAIRGLVHRFHQQTNPTCCDGATKYEDLRPEQVYSCLALHVFDWEILNLESESLV